MKNKFSRAVTGFGGVGEALAYARGSVSEVPGGGEFSTMEKRRDESRRGRHKCLRHSLARVTFDFFTPSYARGSEGISVLW